MTDSDRAVVSFSRKLASIRRMFREAHIFAEKQPCFRSVGTTVSHAERDVVDGDSRHPSVEVSFSVDGDLTQVIDEEKYSLGASVAIRFVQNEWRAEGEVGWSCFTLGWDEYRSFEMISKSVVDLEDSIEAFVASVLNCYREAIGQLTA